MPIMRIAPSPNKNTPARFFGKAADGSPCLLFDGTAVKVAMKEFNKLTHLKRQVGCIGGYTYSTEPNTTLVITTPDGLSPMLKEDADNLAALLNATTHTNFHISGIAEPAAAGAAGTAPLYVHTYGKINGNFEVVRGTYDYDWDVTPADDTYPFAVLTASVTITQDVPTGFNRPSGNEVLIGGASGGEGVTATYPVFPEYFK